MAARKNSSKATTQDSATSGTERVKSRTGKLIEAYVDEVNAESFQNQRTGDFTKGDSNPNGVGNSFKELTQSIDNAGGWDENGVHTGMKDPITARWVTVKKGKQELQVVKGFRRYAVINMLAQRDGIDRPKILVLVKDLTDLEALEENIFENTARDDLTGPDLAWAAYNLKNQYIANGIAMSDNKLADMMGKNQSHISKLIKIVTNAPTVAKAWQESPSPLKLDVIDAISKLEPSQQEDAYAKANAKKAGQSGSGRGAGGAALLDIATKKAERIAKTVGSLVKVNLVTSNINWTSDLETMGIDLEGLTGAEKAQVGKAAHAAFALAVTPPAKPEKSKGSTQAASAEN